MACLQPTLRYVCLLRRGRMGAQPLGTPLLALEVAGGQGLNGGQAWEIPATSLTMAISKHKKEQSVWEMVTRSSPAQHKPADNTRQHSWQINNEGKSDEELALVMRGFLTSFFYSLKMDLREDPAQEMCDLHSYLILIGERVVGLKDNEIVRDQDVEQLHQEILRLQKQQDQLQMLS
ncbi:hypothetical protein NDU88_003015 [Pleurodeles waltl]|uniref:Uncharacterized protein n=1 Tax=Pleurodeles waltl TaxID=8319 RepID=A0AAV7UAZ1_PLEWA|nr:hypothetical protein NDU88_003015 [Pleurodeles waltl]